MTHTGVVWPYIVISGEDALSFLHNQCTSHIKGLAVGHTLETLFLNIRGQIEAMGVVERTQEGLKLYSPQAPELLARFKRYIIMDQVNLTLQPETTLYHSLQAPVTWSSAPQEATALSPEAYTLWRIEHLRPQLSDVAGRLPQETGLVHVVNFKKGCYLGQEIMARLHARGQAKHTLVALEGDGTLPETLEQGELTGSAVQTTAGWKALAIVKTSVVQAGLEGVRVLAVAP